MASTRGQTAAAAPDNQAPAGDNPAGLTAVLQGILQLLQAQQAAPVPTPVTDLFLQTTPFLPESRGGAYAIKAASSALPVQWDGTPDTVAPFRINLQLRAKEVNWGAPAPQGILEYDGLNLLTQSEGITESTLEAAHQARTDLRAIQNSKAMFNCLKDSLSGAAFSTVFGQEENIPLDFDGPKLYKKLMQLTSMSSMEMSIGSIERLTKLDPSDYKYNVSAVNTEISRLFLLAQSSGRTVTEMEKLFHILAIYKRIKQPSDWVNWVSDKLNLVKRKELVHGQELMNLAVEKYNELVHSEGGFAASGNTPQEEMIALLSTFRSSGKGKEKQAHAAIDDDANHKEPEKPRGSGKQPPFVKHFKSGHDGDSTKYKVGDTKVWNSETYHFCDCPNHRGGIKWHTHPAEECRTRLKWLKNKGPGGDSAPSANVADANQDDLTVLLSNVFSSAETEDERDIIATALNAISQL